MTKTYLNRSFCLPEISLLDLVTQINWLGIPMWKKYLWTFLLNRNLFLLKYIFWEIWMPGKIWMAHDCQKIITQSIKENIMLGQLRNCIWRPCTIRKSLLINLLRTFMISRKSQFYGLFLINNKRFKSFLKKMR